MEKKISVIIPTYNRAHIIESTLRSVLTQTYNKWECLIIDDGSTDETEKILLKWMQKDPRFRYFSRPSTRKKGAATCRNIGLANAVGDFIQFLDSDDYLASNKFEFQIEQLKSETQNTIATCSYGVLLKSWKKPKIFRGYSHFKSFKQPEELLETFAENFAYFPLHVYLIPKEIIFQAGPWNEDLTVNDDGEFFSRVILKCEKILFCKDTYVVYRTGAGNRLTGQMATEEGIQAYMRSWELINDNIRRSIKAENHIYVRAARRNLHKRMLKENPGFIEKHPGFFEKKWALIPYLKASLFHRIRSTIKYSYFVPQEEAVLNAEVTAKYLMEK